MLILFFFLLLLSLILKLSIQTFISIRNLNLKIFYIFKSYVEILYSLRIKYPKSHPLNLVAKLLLNSLYGRFGMIDLFPNIKNFKDRKSFFRSIQNFHF